MYFKTLTAVAILMATTSFAAHALTQSAPSSQTVDFVRNASTANEFEIESSQLAIKRTSMKDVKDFALMMVADHTKTGDQLKETLATSGTGLVVAGKLDEEHRKMLDSLKAAATATFDNLYVQAQTDAHDNAVIIFEDYAENGDNEDLQKFAAATVPMLKKHQEMIHSMSQTYVSARQ